MNTSVARGRFHSDAEKNAVLDYTASEGLKSTPAPRSLRSSESPPTPPKKPFSASDQSTEQPRTRHLQRFREVELARNGTRRSTYFQLGDVARVLQIVEN